MLHYLPENVPEYSACYAEEEETVATKTDKQNPMHQAVGFLARRDHSVYELAQKLLKKGHEAATIQQVVEDLKTKGYLDDRRYAEMMLRHHYGRGQGPQKIRHLLNQQCVAQTVIHEIFSDFQEDWCVLAEAVRARRFGNQLTASDRQARYKEKSKQMRFLMARGFESEHIQYAMNSLEEYGETL